MANKQINGFKISGSTETYDLNLSKIVAHLNSADGTDYILKVNNDGVLYAIKANEVPIATAPTTASNKLAVGKLFINSFYCGGVGEEINEHTINYCSHNFVELSNLTDKDINLEGMSLQYSAGDNTDWKVLPLKGIIKAHGTFVIRGAQCSVLNSPTTKIKVENYDMEWHISEGEPIQFSTEQSKFYLTFTITPCDVTNPYTMVTSTTGITGYIDLVGVKSDGGTMNTCEGKVRTGLKNSRLFKKYYAMDPGAKAIKTLAKRSNANDINYVDLSKNDGDVVRDISVYTPKASYESKSLFYDKTDMEYGKPSMITCSFGIQATDNTKNGGAGATRCFNWLSRELDCAYIWITTDKNNWGTPHMTFYEGDGRTAYTLEQYNRLITEYTNNTTIISNKFIMSGLTAGTYYYVAGKKNSDGTPNLDGCTDIHTFTVRTDEDIETNGFSFVQTTDQQGFMWDEYQLWKAACALIHKEDTDNKIQFMLNTGDMTQDGNRLYEWLDYFNGKGELSNMEEMATIGNNDLSHRYLYAVSNGDDDDKVWLENITFFYTFELDEKNLPIFEVEGNKYYIPAIYSFNYGNVHFMCMNSEIKNIVETGKDDLGYGFQSYGNFYPQIKTWCENDMANNSGYTWNLAYCHEMPFTILTNSVVNDAAITARGGSSLNTNLKTTVEQYWFSEFCQTHNIRLVLGGHKHTQATSYPLLENVSYTADGTRSVNSMKPIIVVDSTTIQEFDGATGLTQASDGCDYPETWVENGKIKTQYETASRLCKFTMNDEVASGVCPVVYAMSQATGYKHTSNKELPSPTLPWLRYYHPCTPGTSSDTAATSQKFPFYTIWDIKSDSIEGHVRKLYGGFNNSGKYDINVEGAYVNKGKVATTTGDNLGLIKEDSHSEDIFSVNGLSSSVSLTDTTKTIKISK